MSKKERAPNFTEAERQLLIKVTNSFRTIIECKKTDGKTWRDKMEGWEKVKEKFNSLTEGHPRSTKQLLEKYKQIKKGMKKAHSTHMKYIKGTGGGPYIPPPEPPTEEEKVLAETIQLSIQGLEPSAFEPDGIAGMVGIPINEILEHTEEPDVEVDVDWGRPNAVLLQTQKHPKLSQCLEPVEYNHESGNEDKNGRDILEETTGNEGSLVDKLPQQNGSWLKRRHPVIRKNKTVKSVGGRFDLLAEEKLQLVSLQKEIAIQKLQQDKDEQKLKMEVLEIEKQNGIFKGEMMKRGKLVFEL